MLKMAVSLRLTDLYKLSSRIQLTMRVFGLVKLQLVNHINSYMDKGTPTAAIFHRLPHGI